MSSESREQTRSRPKTSTYSPSTSEVGYFRQGSELSLTGFGTDVVWPEKKQIGECHGCAVQTLVLSCHIGLIDSIFRNFYIPPVIFGTGQRFLSYYALTSS